MKFGKQLICTGMIATMLCLSACGSKTVTMDVATVASDMSTQVTFKDQLEEIDLSSALSVYGIDEAKVKSGVVYMGTGATAEEIAVLEAASANDVADVKAGVENRVEAQKEACENYLPDEMEKLNRAYIAVEGNYVILCVCDDTAQAKEVVNKAKN